MSIGGLQLGTFLITAFDVVISLPSHGGGNNMFTIFAIIDVRGGSLFELELDSGTPADQQHLIHNTLESLMNIADLNQELGIVPEPIIATYIERDADGGELFYPCFVATPIDGAKFWFIDNLRGFPELRNQ